MWWIRSLEVDLPPGIYLQARKAGIVISSLQKGELSRTKTTRVYKGIFTSILMLLQNGLFVASYGSSCIMHHGVTGSVPPPRL